MPAADPSDLTNGRSSGLRIAGEWPDLTEPERRLLTCFRLRAAALCDGSVPDPASRAALALAGLAGEAALLEVLLQVLRRHGRRPFRLARPLAAFVTADERDLLDMLALAQLQGSVRGPGRLWPMLDPQGGRLAARVLANLGAALAAAGLLLPQPALPDVEPTWMPPLAEGRAAIGAFHLVR